MKRDVCEEFKFPVLVKFTQLYNFFRRKLKSEFLSFPTLSLLSYLQAIKAASSRFSYSFVLICSNVNVNI